METERKPRGNVEIPAVFSYDIIVASLRNKGK